jgi:hypothetical protein
MEDNYPRCGGIAAEMCCVSENDEGMGIFVAVFDKNIIKRLYEEEVTNKRTEVVYLLLKIVFTYLFIYLSQRHVSAIP